MNHKYVDIKSQKISPEGKPKIQLQIVMHDGACTTFHFNNPAGGVVLSLGTDMIMTLLKILWS